MVEFTGGTKRSKRFPPLFLCPIELIEAVARTRLEGDTKYEPGNWVKGDRLFFIDCLSHAIAHLFGAAFPEDTDDPQEDVYTHLGHAATNIAFILHGLKHGKLTKEDWRNIARVLEAPTSPEGQSYLQAIQAAQEAVVPTLAPQDLPQGKDAAQRLWEWLNGRKEAEAKTK